MDDHGRRGRLRTFALGSLVGAAGAIATARRLTPRTRRPRSAPAGLAAFEDAPCFLEIVEAEARRYREGGEMSTGRSNPE
ncbi:MAG TPA: hypothetical protein VGJ77_06920 [Gaiellaceae bacterium]|jgi:hypothetical protein